jgi:hypothetical protein
MSIVNNCTTAPNLREEFLYHASESKYHQEQYLNACDEAERHFERWREHTRYKEEFRKELIGGAHDL